MALKEKTVKFEGIPVRCYEGGKGYPILVMHGSGPGASSLGNFGLVLGPLSRRYRVLAYDMVGFGQSGRKPMEPYFDVPMWRRQAQFFLDRLSKKGPVGVIGHSLSGSVGLWLASQNRKIDRLLVTGTMGAPFKLNKYLRAGWTFPKTEADFRTAYSGVVADPSIITDEFVRDRLKVLHAGDYGDYFSKMFKGQKQRYIHKAALTPAQIKKIKCEVVFLHGDKDRGLPFEETALPLAKAIPTADLVRLAYCGHGPSLDQPKKFLHAARGLFG